MTTQNITIHHQNFILHPSAVMYWQEKEMLLIADVHFGKIAHFRKHGSAVPNTAIHHNFEQLDEVVSYFKPKVITFLGDLFHSYINTEWILFDVWIRRQTSKIVLIKGNHDIIPDVKYEKLGVSIDDQWMIGTILLTHHPETREGVFNISGHIHPGIRLKGLGKQSVTLPCFLKKKDQMIVPAFGTFTGKHILYPEEHDQIFVITQDEVIEIPND